MELNTIQTEGTWNEVAERLNDNFRKILLAIQNGAGGGDDDDGDSKIVTIDLDPSKLVQGEEVELTQEQRETLYLAREGYTVFTTCYMDYSGSIQPWGQVISCIQTYPGSSTHVNTITIVSRDGKNFDDANGLIVYTIDNFDASGSRVTSIIRLSDINNKADKATTLSGYGIEDAYTKDEVYSKDEISAAITREVTDKTRDFYTRSEVKEMYALKEDVATELNNKVDKDEVYSKDEMSEAITREVTDKTRDFYTRSEVKEMYALKEDVATELNNKVDKVEGKQLSTEDFTAALKAKLQGLSNYDDTELANAVAQLQTTLDTLIEGDATVAINSFNEIIAFLSGIRDSENLDSIIASIEQQIASKQNTITDLETIREGAALGATAVQPEGLTDMVVQKVAEKTRDFPTRSEVKETYAYRDKDDIQEILGISDWALSSENPSYAKVEMDTKLGLKQDNLESGINIKTINGQSILGSGDIDIGGGEGTITEIKANGTSIATSGVANIPAASTSRYGVTKLSSSYTSTSTSLAATPYAVNKVYAMVQEKQDAETGKGLSTNDYTTEDKTKLAGIADGAEVNVQSDWNVTDASSDAYIKNKPTIPSAVTESTVLGWGFTKNSAVTESTVLGWGFTKNKGTVTGVKLNGSTYIPSSSNGVVDLGSISSEGGGGELNVVAISLDVTKLTVGSYVTITREQYDQLLLTRKGYPVVIADANFSGNYAYESEWGQVISCYRQYFGSSAFMYRLSVIHHDGYMASNTPNTQIYTMEVMDNVTGGGGATSYLYVRAIKNLY